MQHRLLVRQPWYVPCSRVPIFAFPALSGSISQLLSSTPYPLPIFRILQEEYFAPDEDGIQGWDGVRSLQEIILASTPTIWLMDVPGLFSRGQLHFLVGEPGSGKTTFIGLVADILSRGGERMNCMVIQ